MATEEMRNDFDIMTSQNLKPKDFRLKVRNHHGLLAVTSVAKLYWAKDIQISFSGTNLQTYLINKKQATNIYGQNGENENKVNVPFGLAEVNFTVHGISGFKRGDTLRFQGLPENFSYPHVYEVTGLEHEVSTSGWMTKVTTGMRAYGSNSAKK